MLVECNKVDVKVLNPYGKVSSSLFGITSLAPPLNVVEFSRY